MFDVMCGPNQYQKNISSSSDVTLPGIQLKYKLFD